MKNKTNNEHWFFIKAGDGSCVGYWPGKTREDACEKFGIKLEQCSIVKEVVKTDKGFIEPNQVEQRRLL